MRRRSGVARPGILRFAKVLTRPRKHLILLRGKDHLTFGTRQMQESQQRARPLRVGLHGDLIENERADLWFGDEMLGQRDSQ